MREIQILKKKASDGAKHLNMKKSEEGFLAN